MHLRGLGITPSGGSRDGRNGRPLWRRHRKFLMSISQRAPCFSFQSPDQRAFCFLQYNIRLLKVVRTQLKNMDIQSVVKSDNKMPVIEL